MLIATVPYVGKRLHSDLDPDPNPDPKLNYGSGSEHANNFGSGRIRIRIHNPDSPLSQTFCDWIIIFRLLDLSASEH